MADKDENLDPFGFAAMAFAGPSGMNEQIAYSIWGAVATATKAFLKAEVKIDVTIQRVFVTVTLKRWAKHPRLKLFHDAWLRKAETRAREFVPQAWRILVYYEQPKRLDRPR